MRQCQLPEPVLTCMKSPRNTNLNRQVAKPYFISAEILIALLKSGMQVFLVLGFCVMAESVRAGDSEALQVSGKILLERFTRQSPEGKDTVKKSISGTFIIKVLDCKFNIRSTRESSPYESDETFTVDGKTLYSISTLPKPLAVDEITNKLAQVAVGTVDDELTSIAEDIPFNAAVMMVYGSRCYFTKAADGRIPPIWFTTGGSLNAHYKGFTVPYYTDWLVPLQTPRNVFFVDEGMDLDSVPDDATMLLLSSVTNRYSGPAGGGFTNCHVHIKEFTEIDGDQIPKLVTITRYAPVWSQTNFLSLRLVERFTLDASNVSRESVNSISISRPKGPTRISDRRFVRDVVVVPVVAYDITDRWFGKSEVQASVEYKDGLTSWKVKKYVASEKAFTVVETGNRRRILMTFLAVSFAGIVFMIFRSRKQTENG